MKLDYADYLSALQQAKYDGYVTVEVSGQIFNASAYDAVDAARCSYQTLAVTFARAKIMRGGRV